MFQKVMVAILALLRFSSGTSFSSIHPWFSLVLLHNDSLNLRDKPGLHTSGRIIPSFGSRREITLVWAVNGEYWTKRFCRCLRPFLVDSPCSVVRLELIWSAVCSSSHPPASHDTQAPSHRPTAYTLSADMEDLSTGSESDYSNSSASLFLLYSLELI